MILIEIIAFIVWLMLALVRSLPLGVPSVTTYELKRLVKAKDERAQNLARYLDLLPQLRALRDVLSIVLIVILAGLSSWLLGLWFGALVTIASFILLEIFRTLRPWQRLAQKTFAAIEPQLAMVVTKLSGILRLMAQPIEKVTSPFFSKTELAEIITHDHHILSNDEKLLLGRALEYGQTTVAEVMTPKKKIEYVKASETLGPIVLDRLHKTGHSRFPVVKSDLSSVVGTLFLSDLVPLKSNLKHIADAMKPQVLYVHQDKTLEHVLQAFFHTKHHLFLVVDETQAVVGLVTIEDIIEYLFGRKIVDDFDAYDSRHAVAALAKSTTAETTEVVK